MPSAVIATLPNGAPVCTRSFTARSWAVISVAQADTSGNRARTHASLDRAMLPMIELSFRVRGGKASGSALRTAPEDRGPGRVRQEPAAAQPSGATGRTGGARRGGLRGMLSG